MSKSLEEQLEELYIAIGDANGNVPDDVFEEVDRLQRLLSPQVIHEPDPIAVEWERDAVCGNPYCNGVQCWDCAAIRGGCPEDA